MLDENVSLGRPVSNNALPKIPAMGRNIREGINDPFQEPSSGEVYHRLRFLDFSRFCWLVAIPLKIAPALSDS